MPQSLRVLIVEDNPDDAELVLRELRRAGFNPDWNRVATEQGYLEQLHPDLDIILSDFQLPGFGGPRALDLRNQQGLSVPFIIISGTIGEDVAVQVMRQGAADYLLKDRLTRLGPAVRHALDQGRMHLEHRHNQEELRRTHEKLQRMLEHSPAVIYSLKVEGEKVIPQVVSENITRLLGFSLQEASSFDWWAARLHPEDRERAIDSIKETLAMGAVAIEYRLRRMDGQYVWVEDSRQVVRDASGNPMEIAGVWTDISGRRQAEQAREESDLRFRQLAENILEVFWVTDLTKQQMLYISPAYEAIWGRTCESLYARPESWLEAIHEDDRARVLHAAATKQMNGTYDEEYRILRPDGSLRWIRDRAFPVRDASGEIYRMAGVAGDISERRRTDDRLRKQASLLDKARDAIMVRDLEHRITYWNKGAERLYGWTAGEVTGRTVSELINLDAALFEKASDAVVKFGEWNGELQQVTKEGEQILIEARWTLVRDSEGRPQSVFSINTDITEKKKLEQQFLRAQRLESIGTLAGGIAHDLNNVLAPIMMSIDLLKLASRDERTQGVLSTIETSARRGADMVQQILSFARGVEGQRVMVAATEIIRDMQHLVQDTFPKNIVFHADLPAGLPAFLGDHTQVHQVLLNLCVNARDAMSDGGTLTVSASSLIVDENYAAMNSEAKPGTYVMIKVTDTGTGIPQAVVDKIFDPFFTTKEVGKGTGLGLSTVLAIIKSHSGFINVRSDPGKGTTFTVCFPADLPPGDFTPVVQGEMHPRGQGECILIVDDEAAVRMITQQTLEAFGYRVLAAADGAEALALYAQHQDVISAVLTDMMMPVMDGPATIQVLMRMNPALKIIAASGLNADGSAARAAGMGVKHFLPKPYTAQTVLMTLHRVLGDGA